MSNVLPFRANGARRRLLIIGNGMATSKLLDELADFQSEFEITVVGEEAHGCYNRVLLSRMLAGAPLAEVMLKDQAWFDENDIRLIRGVRALHVDEEPRVVSCSDGQLLPFDDLVIATGSRAMVPPIAGIRDDDSLKPGVFVFRTADDATALGEYVQPGMKAVVVGGGLLGLEAAKGLYDRGAEVTVVDRSPGLLARQLDVQAGKLLVEELAAQGMASETEASVVRVTGETALGNVELSNGKSLPCDVLVLACGIQPRVEVARSSGYAIRRAIVVDDELRVLGRRGIYAVGECAEHRGFVAGIIAPIWDQVRRLAQVLTARPVAPLEPIKLYTRLKVAGIEVASMGALEPKDEADEVIVVQQRRARIYAKLLIRDGCLVGAQLLGDATAAPRIAQLWQRGEPLPEQPLDLLCSEEVLCRGLDRTERELCACAHVSERAVITAIKEGVQSVGSLGRSTGAGSGCGSCRSALERLIGEHGSPSSGARAVV